MRVLIVDDHPSFGEGLAVILQRHFSDYHFLAETSPVQALNQLIDPSSDFDLILLDIRMPELNGKAFAEKLLEHRCDIPVIALSAIGDYLQIRQLLDLGVIGFIPKYYTVEQIAEAICYCLEGNVYIPPSILSALAAHEQALRKRQQVAQHLHITKRQLEVLDLIEAGLSNDEIAETLFLSLATVKTHVNRLFHALEASNRKQCIQAANQAGLLIHKPADDHL